jgi:hypothetical protein
MKKTNVNEQVSITALGFKKNLTVYPRRMEFRGVTYYFIDTGLRCLLKCGEHIAEFFTLSDGTSDYHLRLDHSNNGWTLISIYS